MYYRHQGLIGLLVTVFLLSVIPSTADALPRMSATSGAPCSTCHYNTDGGGIRSDIGFDVAAHTGAIDHGTTGLSILDDRETNRALEWLATGMDVRYQMARFGEPRVTLDTDSGDPVVTTPERRLIPMQAQPYILIDPASFVDVYASYAFGPDSRDGDWCSTSYPGQTCVQSHATFRPSSDWPSIRAGLMRPSMGIRHADHTMLTYADASQARPTVIPPNYAELGVEASYQPRHWLRAEAGGFRSDQLSDAIGDEAIVESSDPGYLARVTYLPNFDFGVDRAFYGWVGASVYGAGSFRADQLFTALGWLDRGALKFELTHMDYGSDAGRRAINLATIGTWNAKEWLIVQGRVEQAQMRDETTARRQAAVASLHFYPVPFVKLLPEYRYTRTDDWQMGQYTLQVHFFY